MKKYSILISSLVVLFSFVLCVAGIADSTPVGSGGPPPQPERPVGSPAPIASGSPSPIPIDSPTRGGSGSRYDDAGAGGLSHAERAGVLELGGFLSLDDWKTVNRQAFLTHRLNQGIEVENEKVFPQRSYEELLRQLRELEAEQINQSLDVSFAKLDELIRFTLGDAAVYQTAEDVIVVDVVNFTREIRDIHRLMNPPQRLHPWLKWLLYLNRVTPEMLEFYQAAVERRDRIYTLASRSDGKLKIRYRGRVLDVPIFVWPDEADGAYELVMVRDQAIHRAADASAVTSTVGQTPTP